MKSELIEEIITREWQMFVSVQNEGGSATCQNDPKTFRIMRSSQFECMPEALLASYISDLVEAQAQGRNLMTEKYARMMASTAPGRYREIEHLLPPLDRATRELVEAAIPALMKWEQAFRSAYPRLSSRGRPATTTEDSRSSTSVETYLRGELSTFSQRTLRMLGEFIRTLEHEKRSFVEETMLHTVRKYGYSTLQEAEELLAQRHAH